MTNDTNLPIPQNEFLNELNIVIPPPIILSHDAELDDAKKADIALFNSSLRVVYAMWGEVKTFSAALILIDRTMELIKTRRAILGLPYGSPSDKNSFEPTWKPL